MARPSGRRAALANLYACLVAGAFASSLVPILPLYARQMGSTAPEIGILAAAPLIVALAAPHRAGSGHVPDHHRLALGATVLLAIVPPLCALASAPWQLLCLRALLGLAAFPAANAIALSPLTAGDSAPGRGALAGWVIGPILAAAAAEHWGLERSFLVAGAFGAAASILLAARGLGLHPVAAPDQSARGTAAVGTLSLGGVAAVLAAFLPLYATDARIGLVHIGGLFASAALSAGLVRWLAGRLPLPLWPMLVVGSILLGAAACVGLALATALSVFGVALLTFGTACGGAAAGIPALASRHRAAPTLAMRVGLAAQALAPLLAGVVTMVLGEESMYMLVGITLAAMAVGAAAILPTGKRDVCEEGDSVGSEG